jgi:hypothetical protein
MANPLKDLEKEIPKTPRRTDDELLDVEVFEQDPIRYYQKVLQKVYEYKHYSESQEFIGIILREKILTSEEKTAFLGLDQGSDQEYRFYNVYIPELDAAVPAPKDLINQETINAFYNGNARVAYYGFFQGRGIFPGTTVIISDAIKAEKDKRPCRIKEIRSDKTILIENIQKASEVIKSCIKQKLQPRGPEDIIYPKMIAGLGIIGNTGTKFLDFNGNKKTIFSSKNSKDPKTISPINFPIGTGESITPQIIQDEKDKILSKIIFKPDDILDNCNFDPTGNPVIENQTNPQENVEGAFIKNNIATQLEKVNLPSKFFSTVSEKKKIIRAAEDPNSISPIIKLPPDSRNVSMIVVRNISYLNVEQYHKLIKEIKIPAVHFCIDNNGDTYQFTDTKNLVKVYNPTIDEISVYIGVMNISFRNSQRTTSLFNSGLRRSILIESANTKAAANALQVKTSTLADEGSLRLYYSAKGVSFPSKQTVKLEAVQHAGKTYDLLKNNLPDGRTIFPPYRLDMTEEQKSSLRELVISISRSYNIGLNYPKFGYDPIVASGEFNGIVSPINFSFEETDPVNLYQIFN